jgi:hypothetical protein
VTRRGLKVLAWVNLVLLVLLLLLVGLAYQIWSTGALNPHRLSSVHIPCSISHPFCDEPMDGRWVAP